MNEILLNILSVVVVTIIIPLISFAGARLISYLNTKVKDEKSKKLLTQATNIVTNAVRVVFQTYVESLKKSNSFDKDAQIIALNKAKEIVLSQLNEEVKKYISDNFGDINNWLDVQIEATINILKNKF